MAFGSSTSLVEVVGVGQLQSFSGAVVVVAENVEVAAAADSLLVARVEVSGPVLVLLMVLVAVSMYW
jgi:hypothetical protein